MCAPTHLVLMSSSCCMRSARDMSSASVHCLTPCSEAGRLELTLAAVLAMPPRGGLRPRPPAATSSALLVPALGHPRVCMGRAGVVGRGMHRQRCWCLQQGA